jgi:hypothetical protein
VVPPVFPLVARGQNGHFMSHSVRPPVERTGVAAWLSSAGTTIPGFPVVEGAVLDVETQKHVKSTPSPVLP